MEAEQCETYLIVENIPENAPFKNGQFQELCQIFGNNKYEKTII